MKDKLLLGLMKPAKAGFGATPTEIQKMLPNNVGLTTVALGIQALVESQIEAALSRIEEEAAVLARRGVDAITLGGTPPVVFGGYGFDRTIIDRIHKVTPVPATTGQTSSMEAMKLFRARKVALIVPWKDDTNRMVIKFLEDSGLKVGSSKSANADLKDMPEIPLSRSYALALEALKESPDCDCIYVPCSAWPFSENIEPLEKETGLPVVASTQSWIWGVLRLAGMKNRLEGYGRLFRDY